MERDLEYVYAVYQMGSFSKAAKFLFASQPTVSMAVQRVEEDLGYPGEIPFCVTAYREYGGTARGGRSGISCF